MRRPHDLSNPVYFDAPWPYFEVEWDNLAIIVVSRSKESAKQAKGMGDLVGKNQITEYVENYITTINSSNYIYNGHIIDFDVEFCDFVITFKQKHYKCQTGITSIVKGMYEPQILVMNNPKYIEDYFDLLSKKEQKIHSVEILKEESEMNAQIKKLLTECLKERNRAE
ncbi:hypothetical protein [Vibrio sp. 10N.239.312.D08]|uniref:hypothetical protein n=1 Tax=Vibrio sp. 10N.239.312.D08 TaxID=3229978 RepID=UPI00354DA131